MNQSTFLPRLAAYCMGLPVLFVLYLFTRGHVSMQVMFPLFVVGLFVAIGGQARIRRSYPQDFSKREEWLALGVFSVVVVIGALLVVK
ncbi:hypothetical protein J0X19_00110 [Hymenobacter sp. BT186]|uniref:Uncharacterized protein n=1 Tax=Hymenobacter telluris TaxID=2816474 RepID=A0A939EUU7_9BACT|nr:hypothetical protein [Hymenobacter telluris]MBO0356333.1 hypothetical protein [Hymenobacter telluris]MBW3372357.1 hypothetical protein [Hymenobacter norwichensis]